VGVGDRGVAWGHVISMASGALRATAPAPVTAASTASPSG
jgi:hypothetical protein